MRVRVLGGLQVAGDDGRPLPADDLPRRVRQVLGVLAARHDKPQSKDALADAVWGAELPGNHVAALEHYVSVLRRRLDATRPTSESFIVTRPGGYLFATSRAGLDLAELRTLIRSADARTLGDPARLDLRQRILDLAGDLPFVEDEYADWAEAPRSEVRAALLAAHLELADGALPADPERALRLAGAAIALDSYLERSYQIAMRAATALGRPDDVLRWYERCRRVLDEELSLGPSPETERLRRESGSGRRTDRSRLGDRPPAAPGTFYGRDRAIELLRDGPGVPVVHVVGPIGAGKSALLAELARRTPGQVGVGRVPGTGGALRLVWLRAALAALGGSGVASPGDVETVLASVDRAIAGRRPLAHSELEGVAALLDRGSPVILGIDDAEQLDEDSVTELAWLRQRTPHLRLVLTYRYPSQVSGRPIATLDAGLVLRLPPLTEPELATADHPGLYELSGGIPALVAAATEPPEVALSVAMQVARVRTRWMPPAAWDVLRIGAALGPLRVDQLATLGGLPVALVLVCVDQLLHAHLLVEGAGGQVRHSSALVRDAVAEQVSGVHERHLRRELYRMADGPARTAVTPG